MVDKLTYTAILRKDSDSDWGVEFPDVPGCFSSGITSAEALISAREALQGHLDMLCELNEPVPVPKTDPDKVITDPIDGETVAISLVEAEPPAKTVRINITIQDRLAARLDAAAKAKGTTRSGLISQYAETL